jgi:hypothetical protein
MRRQLVLELVVVGIVAAVTTGWVFQYRERVELSRRLEATRKAQVAESKRAAEAEAKTHVLIERLNQQLASVGAELGYFRPAVLKKYRSSFVEVYAYFRDGKTVKANYGTAGYLGDGFFLTSKHIVDPYSAPGEPAPPTIFAVKIKHRSGLLDAEVVDTGDASVRGEPSLGDWALLKTSPPPAGLLALKARPDYVFHFADPLVRFGNDYNHGVFVSLGYAGQTTEEGWVTWLADLHPGASGGGVLNLDEELVGLNGGALEGDNRLAVIIPIRPEMLRRLPQRPLQAAGR